MTRALFTVLTLTSLSLCGGCKIGQGLHKGSHAGHSPACHGPACHEGCNPGGCPGGACQSGHCPAGEDGHGSIYEPFHAGHQGPPERGGVLAWLGRSHGGPPANAQPAPGPSAAGVSYPYYTNRGPRDFLASDPRGIGPNY